MSTQQLVEQARKLVKLHRESGLGMDADAAANALDQLAAELERLERKPLTQSAVELAFKESLATHYYDFVDGVRFAERAHHIGEGESHV